MFLNLDSVARRIRGWSPEEIERAKLFPKEAVQTVCMKCKGTKKRKNPLTALDDGRLVCGTCRYILTLTH